MKRMANNRGQSRADSIKPHPFENIKTRGYNDEHNHSITTITTVVSAITTSIKDNNTNTTTCDERKKRYGHFLLRIKHTAYEHYILSKRVTIQHSLNNILKTTFNIKLCTYIYCFHRSRNLKPA